MKVVRRDAPIGDAIAAAVGGSAVAGIMWTSIALASGLAAVQVVGTVVFTGIAALGWAILLVPSLVRREVSFDGDIIRVRGWLGRQVEVAISEADRVVALGCTGPDERELSLEVCCGGSVARLRQNEIFESGLWDVLATLRGFRPDALALVWPRSALLSLRAPRAIVFERERGAGAYRRAA